MTYPTGPHARPDLFTHVGSDAHKRQATLLQAYFAHHGALLQRGHVLEAVAALHGLESWRTLLERPGATPLVGETAARGLTRRLAELGRPLDERLTRNAVALLQNPAILLFDPRTAAFFRFSEAAARERELTVQFSETEAMEVQDEDWSLMAQATIENIRAVNILKLPSLGLFNEGILVAPPGTITFLPTRNKDQQHDSGLFMLETDPLSPWPLLPLPESVGADVMKRLQEGRTLTWTKGSTVHLDGAELVNDLGESVPEWVDMDGSRVAAWREQLEQALPGTSHYVVTHVADRAVRVMMRRGVREIPETALMDVPTMALDDRHPMTQTVALALVQQEARTRHVTVTAHPALTGSAGAALVKGGHLAAHDAQTLSALAAELPPGALLVLYLDGSAAEQAAVTAARRGVRVVAVAPARHKEWDRKLQAAWRQNVLES